MSGSNTNKPRSLLLPHNRADFFMRQFHVTICNMSQLVLLNQERYTLRKLKFTLSYVISQICHLVMTESDFTRNGIFYNFLVTIQHMSSCYGFSENVRLQWKEAHTYIVWQGHERQTSVNSTLPPWSSMSSSELVSLLHHKGPSSYKVISLAPPIRFYEKFPHKCSRLINSNNTPDPHHYFLSTKSNGIHSDDKYYKHDATCIMNAYRKNTTFTYLNRRSVEYFRVENKYFMHIYFM